ncbi:MAG: alpha/beta fold hydrolase [Betaproteobacteria bacterium]|nr:alpha/beta fold hydrolase [Betaproteobacteria bacterium]
MSSTAEHFVTTPDGIDVCLVQVAPAGEPCSHVFMTHGAFSDRRICTRLADYLAELGCCCWVLEWRGHGCSQAPVAPYDFEYIGQLDVVAALDYLRNKQGITNLHAVTHSGGGICLTIALLHRPDLREGIHSLSLFACQTSWAALSGWPRAVIGLTAAASRVLGRLPARALRLGPHDEAHSTMDQWYQWNLNRHFIGHAGTDYLAAMSTLHMPVLAIAAKGDQRIAPPQGCQNYLTAFGSKVKRFVLAGPHFGHASVMQSRAARSEIWPIVRAWLFDDDQRKGAFQPS